VKIVVNMCNELPNRVVRKKNEIMRKLFFVALLFSLFSCKKAKEVKMLKQDIVGTWELDRVIGYPFDQQPLPPGNGRIMVLGENGLFERKQHDTVTFRGSYSLRTKKDCHERDTDIIFSTDESSSANYQYIEIYNGELLLSTPNCYQDGASVFFRRLK
jgi:hypothetical protein